MSENEERLTTEEVNATLGFFEAFSKGEGLEMSFPISSIYRNRFYTPDIINEAMKSINPSPNKPKSIEDIEKALSNPDASERILRQYATYFEINNLFYKRLIDFNASLPAWNLTFDCVNIREDADFKSKEFKEDLQIVDEFCTRLNFKKEFRVIVNQLLRQGIYYGVFRDETNMYTWQQLPIEYCKITGDSNVGKLFNFDFKYFMGQTGANIDMYPPIFKKLLRQIYNQMGEKYNPKGKIDNRHSSFNYLIDLSPKNNFFCFTLDNGLSAQIPYYSSLFPDMYLQPMMRNLEKNKAMIAAQKLLVNLLDTYDNAKSGTVPNQYRITPKDVGQFMSLVKSALGDVARAVAIPAKDTKVVDFEVEAKNRYTDYERNIAANSISSSASMLTENKLNQFESELALNIDENFVKSLYGQFENFLNYYINNRTNKFKFKFKLNDTNTKLDRKKREEQFQTLATMGIVDINLYARSTDQTVFEAQRALKFTKSLGIENDLISLMSLNNQSNNPQSKTGRPTDDDSNNDNTVASNERGSNELADS